MPLRFTEKRIRVLGRIYTISRKIIIALFIIVFCSCAIVGYIILQNAKKSGITQIVAPSPTGGKSEPAPYSPPHKMVIHVAGAVHKPGLIYAEEGARIADAIEAAGGLTEEADLSAVNLAATLQDGIKLYIPKIGENPPAAEITPVPVQNGKINLNTAAADILVQLDGIGEATAKKIILYREEHGKFQKIEDLMNVSGIGKAKYDNIKEHICV